MGGTPEGKEMFSRLEEARKRFSDQYDLEPLMRPLIDWLDGQETRREGESPQEYLKRLYQLKVILNPGNGLFQKVCREKSRDRSA